MGVSFWGKPSNDGLPFGFSQPKRAPLTSICLRALFYVPLLVLKGIYHYWKNCLKKRSLNQMEARETDECSIQGLAVSGLAEPEGGQRPDGEVVTFSPA